MWNVDTWWVADLVEAVSRRAKEGYSTERAWGTRLGMGQRGNWAMKSPLGLYLETVKVRSPLCLKISSIQPQTEGRLWSKKSCHPRPHKYTSPCNVIRSTFHTGFLKPSTKSFAWGCALPCKYCSLNSVGSIYKKRHDGKNSSVVVVNQYYILT